MVLGAESSVMCVSLAAQMRRKPGTNSRYIDGRAPARHEPRMTLRGVGWQGLGSLLVGLALSVGTPGCDSSAHTSLAAGGLAASAGEPAAAGSATTGGAAAAGGCATAASLA